MLNLYLKLLVLIAATLLWTSSCDLFRQPDEEVVITVGDRTLDMGDARHEIDQIISDMGITDQDAKTGIKSIINRIVEKILILEYGERNNIAISPEELEAAVSEIRQDYPEDVFREMLLERYIDIKEWKKSINEELLLKKIVNTVTADAAVVTFEEAKEYYEAHPEDFSHPRMLRMRQIVTETEEEMKEILKQIEDGAKMSELAAEHSIAPESSKEGMLGWVSRGTLDETIDQSVFSLGEGEISEILETPYGFHLFEVLSVREEGRMEFPEVMRQIEAKLSAEKRELKYKKWLNGLKKEFPVSIKESKIVAGMDLEE